VTPDVLIAAVRAALPLISIPDERIEVRERPGAQPIVYVVGDASWLDLMPAAPVGERKGSIMVAFYPLGVAILAVEIDLRSRGEA
jgi:hypothetical protein